MTNSNSSNTNNININTQNTTNFNNCQNTNPFFGFNPNNGNLQTHLNYIFINIVLGNIENILGVTSMKENEEFFLYFLYSIPKLEELVNVYYANNRHFLQKICYILCYDYLYKLSYIDQTAQKIFGIAKKLFLNECFEIKILAVKIMAKVCRSKIFSDDIFKFVEIEILTDKNFYNRRLYLYFFEELIHLFSYKLLKEKGVIDELMKLINDNHQILGKFFYVVKLFFPLVNDDNIKFIIFNKLEILRKQINNKEIVDFELTQVSHSSITNFKFFIS